MCAAYEVDADPEAIAQAFRVDETQLDPEQTQLFSTPHERYPRQPALIVIQRSDGTRMLGAARFGFVPHFAKELKEGDKHFNARAETVADKPLFRSAFARHRCLVPVSGFFEWKKASGARPMRHVFKPISGKLLALAGIWETWRAPDGQKVGSFAILTTEPSPLVAPIHNRMPLVLPADAQELWLSAETPIDTLRSLLVPKGEELLAVSPG